MLHAKRLLKQVREQLRYTQYSLRTELDYVQYVRIFVKCYVSRHLRDMRQEKPELNDGSGL